MTRAVLSLGSNVGDRAAYLRAAVRDLDEAGALLIASGVYETPPWGDAEQPDYLNAVVLVVDPRTDAHGWLAIAQHLEHRAGRQRDPARRYGPRTLDVDVIAVWDEDGASVITHDSDLTVPHPRAHERAFVLRPWLDIQPYARLPGHGLIADLVRIEPVSVDINTLRACPEISLEVAS